MEKENKGLDLREFEVEPDSEIKDRHGNKFVLTSCIPMRITEKFFDINAEDFKKEDLKIMQGIIREILYLKNDNSKVDKFLDELSQEDFIYIIEFITRWLKEIRDSKQKKN